MLEFNKRILRVKIDGKVYDINYPRVGEIRKYTVEQKKGGEEVELIINLLEKLGLPVEVTDSMEIENLEALMAELVKTKK